MFYKLWKIVENATAERIGCLRELHKKPNNLDVFQEVEVYLMYHVREMSECL